MPLDLVKALHFMRARRRKRCEIMPRDFDKLFGVTLQFLTVSPVKSAIFFPPHFAFAFLFNHCRMSNMKLIERRQVGQSNLSDKFLR